MAPIIVTGSTIPTAEAEGASPVTVVTSDTIQKRGYQTVEDILQDVPSNGSFSNPGKTSGNFAAGGAYVSLRGLGPQATLVLVNGRRVSNYAAPANGQYAFTDLNSIPAQIVDRVEVLTEGTDIYGSDAVAGVVNIITKTDLGSDDADIDVYFGNTTNKDAFLQRYTVSGGLSSFDKNGYGIVEADFEHQNSIFAGDRALSASSNQSNNGGFDLRSGRTFPGVFQSEAADGAGGTFSINPGVGNVALTGASNATNPNVQDLPDGNPYNFDYNPYTSILPETDRYGVYLNYNYNFFGGNVTPHLDFDYRHNRTILTQAPAGFAAGDPGPTEASGIGNGNVFIVPTNNPFNTTGAPIDILSYRFTDLGPRLEDVDEDVYRLVPSVDIRLGDDWTLNAGLNYNYTNLVDRNVNFASAAQFQNELNSTNPATAYNPFTSVGGNTAAAVNGLRVPSFNDDSTSLISEDFRFNGKLFDLPAGPVQASFGGEYRFERYNQSYGAADQIGDVVGSTIQLDTAASRKILSGYTEVDFPLTSPKFNCPGFYSLDVIASGRVDQYTQFGHTQNPQVRIRWETAPGLVVRGGYSTAFRAPSLPELYAGGNQADEEIFDPVANTFRDVTINGGGNPALKPETAEIFSAGVAYTPQFAKNLLITADFFKIRYNDQIEQQDAQTLIDQGSPQVAHNQDGTIASVTATYANTSNSYIQGIDWSANYVLGDALKEWGALSFTLNATYLLNYITDDGTGAVQNVGEDSGGLGPYSRYRQSTIVTWDYRGFSLSATSEYSSGYTDTTVEQYGLFRNVAANVTFDLQASYTFDKDIDKIAPGPKGQGFDWRSIVAGTRFTVGCNNVYDFTPPFTANPSNPLGYDQSYADGEGRFIYGQLTKRF